MNRIAQSATRFMGQTITESRLNKLFPRDIAEDLNGDIITLLMKNLPKIIKKYDVVNRLQTAEQHAWSAKDAKQIEQKIGEAMIGGLHDIIQNR